MHGGRSSEAEGVVIRWNSLAAGPVRFELDVLAPNDYR
jgi:hypothetical protein